MKKPKSNDMELRNGMIVTYAGKFFGVIIGAKRNKRRG
jgi:hypothetical protein